MGQVDDTVRRRQDDNNIHVVIGSGLKSIHAVPTKRETPELRVYVVLARSVVL